MNDGPQPHTPELAQWFTEEIQPHEPRLRAWLRARFPSLVDVDDLVQETYLRLFRARGGVRPSHAKAYLFATARNAALDRVRRERVIAFEPLADCERSFVLPMTADAAAAIDHDRELEVLTAAIRALPARCREILVLRKHHGLSHQEIATRLGISPHTVNAQLTIAMLKCREFFRAHGIARHDHATPPARP